MFWQLTVFLALLAFTATASPIQDQADAELKAAGMSSEGINSVHAIQTKMTEEAKGKDMSNKEVADKYIAFSKAESQKFLNALSPNDRTVYEAFLKKHGVTLF